MADLETGNLSPDGGFPMSLNRIRTRRESTVDDHPRMRLKLYESEKMAIGDRKSKVPPLPVPAPRPKQRGGGLDHRVKLGAQRGFRRGRKIASWLASYLSKESSQGWYNSSCNQARSFDAKVKALEVPRRTDSFRQQSSANSSSRANVPRDFKSFSHELGIGGLVPPAFPRAHSYDDLKELLGSLHIRFDAAKEVVNVELASFVGDVMDYLQKRNSSFTGEKMANELLILSQECIEMSCYQFRVKCEGIVHDLTEKRQMCETGLLKWLVTRMLFILTRCTRLLQLQKDTEPIDEEALLKFTQCLESVPAVEMSWLPNQDDLDLGTGCTFNQKARVKGDSKEEDNSSTIPEASRCRFEGGTDPKSQLKDNNIDLPHLARVSDFDGSATVKLSNESTCDSILEQEGMDGSEAVICRICEEMVPAVHLESHSYVCAHADKCDRKCLSSDKRLCNLADLLEQIIETCNNSTHSSCSSPEDSRAQPSNSQSASEGCSPKIGDWQDKSVKEMFEDLHEMDTAFMDDPHVANPMFLKGPLAIKLGTYCRNSSTGSMTSVSSTNTPRASHFDSFWLEHYKTFGIEDVHQMIDLADIARCAAATDMSENGSCEFLIACLQDLQEVLQKSKLRALVIDTFGGRIENLLREKYVLGCELLDSKGENDGRPNKSSRILSDDASHSSAISTPRQLSNKDRTSIDDFEIIKPISRGAFGKVFLARKRTTGDIFAIKVLKKLDMLRKNDIERILAERNILIAVRNPFVVRFFYSFTSRDNLYLVMEYLNGGDLYSLLRKVGCLEEDVARIYVAELVLALEYLHSLGIVHRDLKPDNILIAHDGHIKLTDFGLSKFGLMNSTASLCGAETDVIDAENRNFQQTEDESRKSAVGTPDYLAPEILLGTDHGYAADWWSVGIILFELLTGVPPFTAECPEKIFDNILNRKIPWPSIPSEMSYAAQDLINRFLILDSDQRLGAKGSSEVKEHPFFKGVNWDTLALQKAAFVPQPDTVDDTSYFLSRYGQSFRMSEDSTSSDSASECSSSCSNVELEMDEYGDLEEFDSSSQYLSLLNFSFKNLSQLASINHDVLLRSGKDSTKCSSSSQAR